MNATDRQTVKSCYRSLREIALRAEETKEVKALNGACSLLLAALGEEGKIDSTIAPLVQGIFQSKAGFLFVPLL